MRLLVCFILILLFQAVGTIHNSVGTARVKNPKASFDFFFDLKEITMLLNPLKPCAILKDGPVFDTFGIHRINRILTRYSANPTFFNSYFKTNAFDHLRMISAVQISNEKDSCKTDLIIEEWFFDTHAESLNAYMKLKKIDGLAYNRMEPVMNFWINQNKIIVLIGADDSGISYSTRIKKIIDVYIKSHAKYQE